MAATAKRPEIIDLARGLNGTPWCEEYEYMISGMMLVSPKTYDYVHTNRINLQVRPDRSKAAGSPPSLSCTYGGSQPGGSPHCLLRQDR